MSDAFTPYETGLARFLERLGQDHPRYTEALTLEAQLRENVGVARLDGDTETRRADRARILRVLNRLALETVQISFNDLCGFPGVETGGTSLPLRAESLGLGTHPFGPARDRWRNPKDGKEMVRVPAGKFRYGDDKKEVELPEFWISKAPVTNAEYARFVAETGQEPPKPWKGKTPPGKIADHPVTDVSWHHATAYAKWAGGRLPTEEEWEKAARGTDAREYPWGEWTKGCCNSKEAGTGGTTPVGQYSPHGDSPYGCVDMAGNIWEWTTSEHELGGRVLRGGAFFNKGRHVRCAFRFRLIPLIHYRSGPDNRGRYVGFRLVASPVRL